MRVIVVEDDPHIGDALSCGLRQAGFAVDWVCTAGMASSAVQTHSYGVMILDLSLPDRSGLDLLKEVRAADEDIAVLVVTARDGVGDRVLGLDAGADDYMVKPFDLDEICARIRALQRRAAGRPRNVIVHGDVEMDPATRSVTRDGHEIVLSRREFDILRHMLERKGKVVSRASLEEQLYSWGEEIASNSVEVHIHHLRRKLGAAAIRTVRGVGYVVDEGQ